MPEGPTSKKMQGSGSTDTANDDEDKGEGEGGEKKKKPGLIAEAQAAARQNAKKNRKAAQARRASIAAGMASPNNQSLEAFQKGLADAMKAASDSAAAKKLAKKVRERV